MKKNTSIEKLCPECFKVVGSPSRYKLVRLLGKSDGPLSVTDITKMMKLTQPTITHHLQVLSSLDALILTKEGNKRLYSVNTKAHCFKECNIPFK